MRMVLGRAMMIVPHEIWKLFINVVDNAASEHTSTGHIAVSHDHTTSYISDHSTLKEKSYLKTRANLTVYFSKIRLIQYFHHTCSLPSLYTQANLVPTA